MSFHRFRKRGSGPLSRSMMPFFLGDTKQKELYLTFDNGYENGYTSRILDVLKEKQVPAIFFVTGHYIQDQPELLKRMVQEGHLIGNHSWSHPDLTQVSDQKLKEELDRVKTKVAELTSQKEMPYLRPPRGFLANGCLRPAKDTGIPTCFGRLLIRTGIRSCKEDGLTHTKASCRSCIPVRSSCFTLYRKTTRRR